MNPGRLSGRGGWVAAVAAGALLGALSLSGCRIGGDGRSYREHNDELRRSNLELSRQLEHTRQQVSLLEGELASHRRHREGPRPMEGAVTPVLSGLDLVRYTGPVDLDGDRLVDEVRLYLRPLDQRGRMLVVAGVVEAQAVELRAGEPPRVVAEQTFDPQTLAASYRTGLTGDHFSLILPLAAEAVDEVEQLTVKVTLTEAGTGAVVSAQAVYGLR